MKILSKIFLHDLLNSLVYLWKSVCWFSYMKLGNFIISHRKIWDRYFFLSEYGFLYITQIKSKHGFLRLTWNTNSYLKIFLYPIWNHNFSHMKFLTQIIFMQYSLGFMYQFRMKIFRSEIRLSLYFTYEHQRVDFSIGYLWYSLFHISTLRVDIPT